MDDEFEFQHQGAFSGLSDALLQFAQQLSGALQVPLTRLLGQSPKGLGNEGESDLRVYYDGINQQQNRLMHRGVTCVYRCIAQSKGIKLPDDFELKFASLWQLQPVEKSAIAANVTTAVLAAKDAGVIGMQTTLRELRELGKETGVFTNITDEAIEAADDEVMPPNAELDMQHEHEEDMQQNQIQFQSKEADKGRQHQLKLAKEAAKNKPQPGGRKRVSDAANETFRVSA
jgi:hypothetical protein